MELLIIDSSVAVAWFVPDERTTATQSVFDRVIEEGALVPLHWRLEVGNALLVALRRHHISAEQRHVALDQLLNLQLATDPETIDRAWTGTLDLAERHRLTLYDAAYLELAIRSGLALASLDLDLRDAARRMNVPLFGL